MGPSLRLQAAAAAGCRAAFGPVGLLGRAVRGGACPRGRGPADTSPAGPVRPGPSSRSGSGRACCRIARLGPLARSRTGGIRAQPRRGEPRHATGTGASAEPSRAGRASDVTERGCRYKRAWVLRGRQAGGAGCIKVHHCGVSRGVAERGAVPPTALPDETIGTESCVTPAALQVEVEQGGEPLPDVAGAVAKAVARLGRPLHVG